MSKTQGAVKKNRKVNRKSVAKEGNLEARPAQKDVFADENLSFQNTHDEIAPYQNKEAFFKGLELLDRKFTQAVQEYAEKNGIKLKAKALYRIVK